DCDVEQSLVEGVRGADAGGVVAGECRPDLGPGGEALGAADASARVDERAAAPVDDHDTPAGLPLVRVRLRREHVELPVASLRRLNGVLGERGERRRVVRDLRGQVAALGALVLHAERQLEAEQDEQRHTEVAEQQPAGHGTRSRKPTPRTVSIQAGSPSFLRNEATWTSIVFAEPYQLVCQTSARRRRRLTAAPGSRASAASRSNSFGVSSRSRPASVARRARSSISSSPTRSGSCAPPPRAEVRRATARMRAISSRSPYG